MTKSLSLSPLKVTIFLLFTTISVSGQNWNQIIKSVASDRENNKASGRSAQDNYGQSVAISGDFAIVGAPFEDEDSDGKNYLENAGAAYIYQKIDGTWQRIKKICSANRQNVGLFGFTVDIRNGVALVGAGSENSARGAVYFFAKDEGGDNNWGFFKRLGNETGYPSSYFGGSVSISGDIAVIGYTGYDLDLSEPAHKYNAGTAYVYTKDSGGSGNWGQVASLVAQDADNEDNFGFSVSNSGDLIIVGAYTEDHDPSGGSPMGNSGSAYIFSKHQNGQDQWGQVKKIVASDRIHAAFFGY